MLRFNKKLTIYRRTEGALNPAGEPAETWPVVTNGTDISVNLQPLSMGAVASLAQADPGRLLRSSHRIIFQPGIDVQVDDRLLDSDGNYYVVQHKASWSNHINTVCGITDLQ